MSRFVLFICLIFLFLRLFNIHNSLFFQNDIGRDLLVLNNWITTHKPPLLGPQTSFVGFNQSPIYFYLFFPFFILFAHSPFTTIFATSFYYLAAFLFGWIHLKKQSVVARKEYLLYALLVTIQPYLITQHRYVWNPSYVPLFIATAFFSFIHLKKEWSRNVAAIFCSSLALSVGMSLASLPCVIACALIAAYRVKNPKRVVLLGIYFLSSLCVVYFPLIIFELRHSFQITQSVVQGLSHPSATGKLFIYENLQVISKVLLPELPLKLTLLAILVCVLSLLWYKKKLSANAQTAFLLFLLTLFLTSLAPFRLEAHYAISVVTCFLICLATLPQKTSFILVCILSLFWLQPKSLQNYFHNAPRTVQEMQTCFKSFCEKNSEPLFVSVESSFHHYHQAPEFQFLLKEAGCSLQNINLDPTAAQKMLVVADMGIYTHNKTAYNELTLFGKANETEKVICKNNFSLHLLQKI